MSNNDWSKMNNGQGGQTFKPNNQGNNAPNGQFNQGNNVKQPNGTNNTTGKFNGGNFNNSNQPEPPKGGRKGLFIKIGLGVVLVFGGMTTAVVYNKNKSKEVQQVSIAGELKQINNILKSGNAGDITSVAKESFISQEWAYFNKVKIREDFFKTVMSTVNFDTRGLEGKASVNSIDVEHIDWSKIAQDMEDFNFKKIQEMYAEKGIKREDYEFKKKMVDLFAEYIVKMKKIPVTVDKVPLQTVSKGNSVILSDDINLDKVLFSSNDFHKALDTFGGIATGDIGTLEPNPNYSAWENKLKNLDGQLKEEETKLTELNTIIAGSERNRNEARINKSKADSKKNLTDDNNAKADDNNAIADESSNGTDSSNAKDESNKNDTDSNSAKDESNGNGTDSNNAKDEGNKDKADSKDNKTYAIKGLGVKNPELNGVNSVKNQIAILKDNEPLKTYVKKKTEPNPKWEEWNKLDEAGKKAQKEPKKDLEIEIKPQSIIPYTWVGAYYLKNDYTVNGKKVVIEPEVGDGTFKRPLGLGTPIVTKMKAEDGQYYDVRVTLLGYKTGQKAIDYAVSFDERNRGFDIKSELSLMTVEYVVENLTDKEVTLNSEFTLSDKNENLVSRTGSMYNLAERVAFKPHETKKMQDWFYTKDLKSRYLIWGKSFERKHPSQWYKILQGENPDTNGNQQTNKDTQK
ncbi:hypothetical protein [Bacillus toyonensis]|uniref:hypothetical protein n=1 Tax=Bacillus toyonensis TaxID=155322 RepID=UPI00159BD916|nr:hypothetical protein [Bacillus toyonensis]